MSYLSPDDLNVIDQVLNAANPPTNPAALLQAARNWYLDKGSDPVLRSIVSWLSEVIGTEPIDVDSYHKAREVFCHYLLGRQTLPVQST